MYETSVVSGKEQSKHCIKIGEKAYEVPLMGDVPYDELNEILEGTKKEIPDPESGKTIEVTERTPLENYKIFLGKHLPKKVVAGLSVNQLRMIQSDWAKYSRDAMGITPGES